MGAWAGVRPLLSKHFITPLKSGSGTRPMSHQNMICHKLGGYSYFEFLEVGVNWIKQLSKHFIKGFKVVVNHVMYFTNIDFEDGLHTKELRVTKNVMHLPQCSRRG